MSMYKYIALIRGLILVVVLSAPMMVVGAYAVSSSAVKGAYASCNATSSATDHIHCTSNGWTDGNNFGSKTVPSTCGFLKLVEKHPNCKQWLINGQDVVTCTWIEANETWSCDRRDEEEVPDGGGTARGKGLGPTVDLE